MPPIKYSIKTLKKLIKRNNFSKVCIITSEKLLSKFNWAIKEIGVSKSDVILVPDAEKAKDWKEVEKILKKFNSLNIDRKSVIIALGGGSVGDIAGFASSIYLRGVKYIQIPTTLLAQVDSAHGGKTGINFLGYKNQIGSFNLPAYIILDKRFIYTLSENQIIDGLGEIIKYGLIRDPKILALLKAHNLSNLINSHDLDKIIQRSINVKNHFISADLKDVHIRQILNIGHTVGHALELKYKISHGRAVIIGLIQELKMMENIGFTPTSIRKSIEDLIESVGIKLDLNLKIDWNTIIHDKKIYAHKIDFPVITKIGRAKIIKIELKELKHGLKSILSK